MESMLIIASYAQTSNADNKIPISKERKISIVEILLIILYESKLVRSKFHEQSHYSLISRKKILKE